MLHHLVRNHAPAGVAFQEDQVGQLVVLSSDVGFQLLVSFYKVGCLGILTIRADDQSVLDFLKRAVRFFITDSQEFYWQEKSVGEHDRREAMNK